MRKADKRAAGRVKQAAYRAASIESGLLAQRTARAREAAKKAAEQEKADAKKKTFKGKKPEQPKKES